MDTIARLERRDVAPPPTGGAPACSLSGLRCGQECVIAGIDLDGDGKVSRRLYDLGFAPGRGVSVLRRSLAGGRAVYRVSGCDIALRRQQADLIMVIPS